MRVLKNIVYTTLSFLAIFGTIVLLVMAFLYMNPGVEQTRWWFKPDPLCEPLTLEEYETFTDPSKPDPRHKEWRNAQFPKQAARD